MAKILAVDDSASMRGMVALTLRTAGYDVSEAENGQLALDSAAASRFDLVLADVNMPVMDGISMVRELRTRPEYKGVPILMLTTELSTASKESDPYEHDQHCAIPQSLFRGKPGRAGRDGSGTAGAR
jgi:two-component system chemotaxis response regulator CheY